MSNRDKSKQELLEETFALKLENEALKKAYIEDIAERKRIEQALIESETLFRLLAENSTDMIARHDLRGMFIYVSPACRLLLGYEPEELIGRFAFEFIHKDDLEKTKISLSNITNNPVLSTTVFRFLHKNGHYIWFETTSRVIIDENTGSAREIHASSRDVSERKISEEMLQEIIDKNPISIQILDAFGRTLHINNSFKELFKNVPPADYSLFSDPLLLKQEMGRLLNKMQAGEVVHFPVFYYNPREIYPEMNDSPVWIRMIGFPISDLESKGGRFVLMHTNVTEQKRTEDELRLSEEKHRLLVDNSHDIIYTINPDGILTFVSPAWTTLLGHQSDQVVGRSFQDFVHPDDIQACWNWIKTVIEAGQRQEGMEYRVRHLNGTWFWHTSSAVPLKDSAGVITGFEGTGRDITERRLTQAMLHDIIDKNPISIQILGLDGRTSHVNDSFIKLFGNVPPADYSVFADPLVIQQGMGSLLEELRAGNVVRFPVFFHNPHDIFPEEKDMPVWVSMIGFPILGSSGLPSKYVLMHSDITNQKRAEDELRESEEKLSALFGSMTEMVALHELVYDESGEVVNYIIVDCNKAFTKTTGIKKMDAIGKLATEIYNTDTPPYLQEFSQVAISGKPYEYSSYFPPMDKHFAISVVSPKYNTFATITTDITAIKQIQDLITEKNKELENYLYVASHDLRSPLVNIQGFSQRLKKNVNAIQNIVKDSSLDDISKNKIDLIIKETIPKTLDYIFSNVTKMEFLINGLLQISRTGRILMINKRINMNKFFESIINSVLFRINEISASVNVADLPDCNGDENLLNSLFSNILSNAINYKDNSRRLVIDISAVSHYNKVTYIIKDNGIGISPRHIDRIWDVFYRVNSAAKDSGEGLGLSIVKRIADKHKGKVRVESVEGVGSTFYVELLMNKFSE